MNKKHDYTNISIDKKPESEVVITGEIPIESLEHYRASVIKNLSKEASLPGFRKGHVPEKILVEKIGEQKILEDIAEQALGDAYPHIVMEHKLAVIGRPQVSITKLAPGNPIGFTIHTAVLPEFTLPDYKKIAKESLEGPDDILVTDEEVDKVLMEVRRGRARLQKIEKEKAGEKIEEPKEGDKENLPELDDTFVATLGDFKTVADFKTRVREDLIKEKEMKAKEKKRVAMSEKIIEETSIPLPKIIIESELDKMMAQMEDDVARMNMKFEDYLAHVKKTREDLRKEWTEQAKKRASLQLILNAIAEKEKIAADHDEIHKQMDHILEHFKDANPDSVHTYVETQLTNEAVFQFLEKTA
jgi:trigger factor